MLLLIVLAYLPLLGLLSVPLTGDQKVYLATALEMRERGSWLTPYLFGEPSFIKPPLEYWALLTGWKFFGLSLWGALFPSFLCVLISAALLNQIARALDLKIPLLASPGLWFAGSLGAATFGTVAQMEILLLPFYLGAWAAVLRYLREPYETREPRWLWLAWGLAGVLSWVKSPLYSVLWAAGLGIFLWAQAEFRELVRRRFWMAAGFGAAIGASWYFAVFLKHGQVFWTQYVVRESIEKQGGNGGSVLSLWWGLTYLSFPFCLIAPWALVRTWFERRESRLWAFFVSAVIPPAVFFSCFPYRVKTYLFIVVPFVALICAAGASRAALGRRVAMGLQGLLAAGLMVTAAVVLWRGEITPVWLCVAAMGVGVTFLAVGVLASPRAFALMGLAFVLVFRLIGISIGEQDLSGLRVVAALKSGASFTMLDEHRNVWHEWALLASALGQRFDRVETWDRVADALQAGSVVILSDEQREGENLRVLQAKLMGRGDMRDLETQPWRRWKTKVRFPYAEVVKLGRAGMPDFDERTQREFLIVSLAKRTP